MSGLKHKIKKAIKAEIISGTALYILSFTHGEVLYEKTDCVVPPK